MNVLYQTGKTKKSNSLTNTPITVSVTTGKVEVIGQAGAGSVLRALRRSGIQSKRLPSMPSAAEWRQWSYPGDPRNSLTLECQVIILPWKVTKWSYP